MGINPAMGYKVNQGGLMRCCLATLDMVLQRYVATVPLEGMSLYCCYCGNPMIHKEGTWQWNKTEA
jgi:hypothetical protein